MSKPDVHVVHKNDKWAVKKEGSQRAVRTFYTQKDALVMAKELARRECVELFIHGRDGVIRDRMSYGNDPRVEGNRFWLRGKACGIPPCRMHY